MLEYISILIKLTSNGGIRSKTTKESADEEMKISATLKINKQTKGEEAVALLVSVSSLQHVRPFQGYYWSRIIHVHRVKIKTHKHPHPTLR